MTIKAIYYECFTCRKQNVRLLRPFFLPYPLICIECARRRQIDGDEGLPSNALFIDISDISILYKISLYSTGTVLMIPAYPAENYSFYSLHSATDEVKKWWNELPIK